MDLGEKLYELRRAKNLSQENVAEQLNVTRQTISKWETNQSTPDFDKIVPLCELYGITPNELLTGEKTEEKNETEENDEKNNFNELKDHLFTRGKDEYENMTKSQAQRKTAEVVSGSVFIFIFAIALVGVGVPVFRWNPILMGCTFLLLIGLGVTNLIRHFMSVPKFEKTEEEKKEDEIIGHISGIIGALSLIIYFIVSFTTHAWHITWIIFIINGLIDRIIKLLFMLKDNKNQE